MNDIDSIDSGTVRPIPVERLRLDDANPRLPESRRGQTQSEILDFLHRAFEAALQDACRAVGLEAAPDAAPRLARAHDAGVDVLGHLGWENGLRPGTWAFIGQVTVGKSDTWTRKIEEPGPQPWSRRLGAWIPPLPFLAVPHHVEGPTMEMPASEGPAVVLDRLRVVRFKNGNGAEEREIIRAVADQEVAPLTG